MLLSKTRISLLLYPHYYELYLVKMLYQPKSHKDIVTLDALMLKLLMKLAVKITFQL